MVSDNSSNVKIECICLAGSSQTRVLRVYTREIIDNISREAIRKAWRGCMLCMKRRMTIKNNEIRIFLKKGDTVQKYVDSISMIIRRIRYYENNSRKLHLKQRMKFAVLIRKPPSRYYTLKATSIISEGNL